MTARPHDADEPEPVEPEPLEPPAPDRSRADGSDSGEPHPPGGTSGTGGQDVPEDVEAQWLEIVARLEATPTDPGDATADPVGPTGASATGVEDRSRVVRPAAPSGPRTWAPDPAVEEAEDHFEPPDPGPVLAGDPLLTMAWAAVIGVPALLLIAVVAWRDIPTIILEVAGGAFVGAVGLLLWRMPRHRDEDSGPGAVV